MAKATHRESRRASIRLGFTGKERKERRINPSLRCSYSSRTGP
jgi:hypothetical protein